MDQMDQMGVGSGSRSMTRAKEGTLNNWIQGLLDAEGRDLLSSF